jgi:hypothetical protein
MKMLTFMPMADIAGFEEQMAAEGRAGQWMMTITSSTLILNALF